MEIGPPYFRLKGRRCPCDCGGEGSLVFISCPSCHHVALACDEIGTVFPNPRDLSRASCGSWLLASGSRANCPGCDKAPLTEFWYSTGDEVQSIGFLPSEYE